MMTALYTIHGHNEGKVGRTMAAMRALGAPSIRVVDCGDHWFALEGVHRLEAAARLGVAPELIVLQQTDLVPSDTLDSDCLASGESYPAGELAGEWYGPHSGCYRLHEDGTVSLEFNGSFIPADED